MATRQATASPQTRPGPRPLPLHLWAQASTLMASCAGLPSLKDGSPFSKPSANEAAATIRDALAAAGPEAWSGFRDALLTEALDRHRAFLDGIAAYRDHPYSRDVVPPPVLWREGTTRLLDYRGEGGAAGLPVLVVPSLVNRAYILDLSRRRSLMRALAAKGLAPFLVDWDAPGEAERDFDLTDYVAGRLERALDAVVAACGRPVAALGYCMGGLLALALAQRRPEAVRSLVLLATPWDFVAGRAAHATLLRSLEGPLSGAIGLMGGLPVDLQAALFASLDPTLAPRKFAAFARTRPGSAKARDFVALEDWVNDGVPLAPKVAQECLFGWYGRNEPAEGRWRVAGQPVRPQSLVLPALVVVPERDRIVPAESALPLAQAIPGAHLRMARGGHVGMLLSARATTEVYTPLAKWLIRSVQQ